MADSIITPEVSLLAALLDNNQKATKSFYSESSNAPTRKRQRLESDDTTTEGLSNAETVSSRFITEYSNVQQLPAALAAKQPAPPTRSRRIKAQPNTEQAIVHQKSSQKLLEGANSPAATAINTQSTSAESVRINSSSQRQADEPMSLARTGTSTSQTGRPEWHPPWKLMRVISGHLGWVRSLAVEPGNKWFASGAGDRTIKIWDLATGSLRLTLTGHISTVRGLAVSPRHPYLFSCGEDKMVKCWDLETNKVIRHYHGHLSGG